MPDVELFLTELRVGDRHAVVSWYANALRLAVVLEDPAGDYTLLDAGPARLAIKGGRPGGSPGSALLVFRVDDLDAERLRLSSLGVDAGPVEVSDEGFASISLVDPAGNPVRLFQWIGPDRTP